MKKNKKSKAPRYLGMSGLARQTGDAVANVSLARNSTLPSSYNQLIALVKANPSLSSRVFNPPFPTNFRSLKNVVNVPRATSSSKEFYWAKTYLRPFIPRIEQFRELADEFQRGLISGELQLCQKLLSEIEEVFGVSLWLIKTRILYLHLAEGPKSATDYTKRIVRNSLKNGFVGFIAHYVNQQNEPTMSFNSFRANINSRLGQIRAKTPDLADYLEFQLLPSPDVDASQMANILRFESSGSVIDYYETLSDLCQLVVAKNDQELLAVVPTILKEMAAQGSDGRFKMLLFELGEYGVDDVLEVVASSPEVADVLDVFLRGSSSENVGTVIRGVNNFDLAEISARILSVEVERHIGKDSFLAKSLAAMRSIILKLPDAVEAASYLRKLSLIMSSHAWGRQLRGFVTRELAPYLSEEYSATIKFGVAGSSQISPLRTWSMDQEALTKWAELNRRLYGDRLSVKYLESLATRTCVDEARSELSREAVYLLDTESAILGQDPKSALDTAWTLEKSTNSYYRRKGRILISYCLLKLRDIDKGAELLTNWYLDDGFDSALGFREATELALEEGVIGSKDDISIPILLDIYSKHIGPGFEAERRYAYEEFLFSNNVERPSHLVEIYEKFDRSKLIYFLRFIATESTMDESLTVFSGSRDIAEERISICRLLVQLDPSHAEEHQAEIRQIIGRLVLKQRVRDVQRSKIYVDSEAIIKKISKNLRDSFDRYKTYRFDQPHEMDVSTDVVSKEGDDDSVSLLVLPEDEATEILESIVIELRDQFVSNNEHGLDGYLSVRIRHGTLAGELRGPLESANLLTKRDSITGGHKISQNLPSSTSSYVANALKEFTASFDSLINEMTSEWIQVKRDSSGKGVLDFTLTNLFLNLVGSKITEQTTFEEFTERLFTFFYAILDIRLEELRIKVAVIAKSRAINLLTNLIADLEVRLSPGDPEGLIRSIKTAQTEMQRVFDRVTEWFRLSKDPAKEPFSIEDAINISRESVSTFTRGVDTTLNIPPAAKIIISGRFLTSFVDILSIIFENILRHSALQKRPLALIDVAYTESAIRVVVQNEIASTVDTAESRNRIDLIKAAMSGDQYGRSISKEGGTGFHKIWKILNYDFLPKNNRDPYLDFGFENERSFFVAFDIPIKESLYESAPS